MRLASSIRIVRRRQERNRRIDPPLQRNVTPFTPRLSLPTVWRKKQSLEISALSVSKPRGHFIASFRRQGEPEILERVNRCVLLPVELISFCGMHCIVALAVVPGTEAFDFGLWFGRYNLIIDNGGTKTIKQVNEVSHYADEIWSESIPAKL